jgi:putative flippase GtrA
LKEKLLNKAKIRMAKHLVTFQSFVLNLLDWFYKPFRKIIPPETFRYAAMGGINTFLDIFLYFICYNFILRKQMVDLGFVTMSSHIASFVFVFPITFVTGFLAGKYITFTGSSLKGNVQLFRYAIAVAGSIVLNYVFLKIFVEIFFIWPTVSKLLTTIVVVIYSYIIQRYFTFKTANIQS